MQRSVARDRDRTPIVADPRGPRPVRTRRSDESDQHAASLATLLRGTDPARLRAARAVAVLDAASTVDLAAQLSGADPDEMRGALGQLSAAGLIEQERFTHPALAAHVLRDLSAAELRELHARAAELLHRNGFPASTVAAHLARAGEARGAWATQVLLDAAAEALTRDELDCAAERLELAYRASRRADDRAAIASRQVAVEWRIAPSTRTRSFARLRAALYSGRLPHAELPATTLQMLWHGHVQHADHALARLAQEPPGPPAATARVEFLCTWLRYTHPAHVDRHRALFARHLRSGPHALEQPGEQTPATPELSVAGLLTALSVQHPPAEIGALAQRILTAHRLDSATVEALVAAVDCLIHLDRLDTAEAWCASLLAEAQARRAPTWRSIFAAVRAETLLRKGNLTGAIDSAVQALNLVPAEHLGVWAGRPIAVLVRALTAQGRHTEASAQLCRPVPRAMFESRFALPYLQSYGHHCLATGQPQVALRYFRRCGELTHQWDMDFAWLMPWRNDMAAAYVEAGEPRRAQAFATMHLKLIGGPDRHHSGAASLRLLAATGDPHRRLSLLRHAVAVARSGHDRLELATALAELGRAHRSVGDAEKARPLLREATRLAVACGSDAPGRVALRTTPDPATAPGTPTSAPTKSHGALIRPVQPPATTDGPPTEPQVRLTPSGVETLSPAERRVADLAALGRRNREIADALHITPSTVEQHLTRVYRKLSVARRGELRFILPPMPAADSAVG